MKPEIRTTTATSLRTAVGKAMSIEGTAASFNVLSSDLGGFREMIAPGAFDLTLADPNQDVKMLLQHSPDKILGRKKNGTLKVWSDARGLQCSCTLDPNNSEHTNAYALIKRGDLSEMSFAFTVPDGGDSWDSASDPKTGVTFARRTLRNVTLLDCSAVTFPAYSAEGATQISARAASMAARARNKPAPVSDAIGDVIRRHKCAMLADVVSADRRTLTQESVSSLHSYMHGRLTTALAAKGTGWRLVAFSSDDDGDYCLACPSETDVEDNAFPPVGRFNYQIDNKSGEVILGAYSRYVYEMGPDGPIMPANARNAWQLGGPRFAALVSELRLATNVRRKMRSSAGIFTRR